MILGGKLQFKKNPATQSAQTQVPHLRWFYEGQPIGRVRRQQPHGLTFVDGQRRAQEVTDQVDQALKPLLAGALQHFKG